MYETTDRSARARLLISCPDRQGIVAAVTQFLFERGANILDLDQHATQPEPSLFFLRLVLEVPRAEAYDALSRDFAPLAERYQMDWRLQRADVRPRVAIFVSKEDHCLTELLWRHRAGELPMDIAMVVGNHAELGEAVRAHGLPFHHVPVTKENKPQAFAKQLELVSEARIDLVVLARYMQILPPEFCERMPKRIINIHHSFLPAFVGANPYAQAWERGVKLIGATAHYVTSELDAGPIIDQDVARVGHRHDVADLKREGKQLERAVLARAVQWHVEDRVLVHGNKTIVFR